MFSTLDISENGHSSGLALPSNVPDQNTEDWRRSIGFYPEADSLALPLPVPGKAASPGQEAGGGAMHLPAPNHPESDPNSGLPLDIFDERRCNQGADRYNQRMKSITCSPGLEYLSMMALAIVGRKFETLVVLLNVRSMERRLVALTEYLSGQMINACCKILLKERSHWNRCIGE